MDSGAYAGIAIAQIAIVCFALVAGSWYAMSAGGMTDKFLFNVAQTVVIFLPLALAWFGIFSAMFLENVNLLLPVLVGVAAVGANFAVEKLMYDTSFVAILSWPFTAIMNSINSLRGVA